MPRDMPAFELVQRRIVEVSMAIPWSGESTAKQRLREAVTAARGSAHVSVRVGDLDSLLEQSERFVVRAFQLSWEVWDNEYNERACLCSKELWARSVARLLNAYTGVMP